MISFPPLPSPIISTSSSRENLQISTLYYSFYRVSSELEALRIVNQAYERLTGKPDYWEKFVNNDCPPGKYPCREEKVKRGIEVADGMFRTKTIYEESLENILDRNISIENYKEYTLLQIRTYDWDGIPIKWKIALNDYIARSLSSIV